MLGLLIMRSPALPSWLGWLLGIAGIGDLATGFVVSYAGFPSTLALVSVPAAVLAPLVAIGIWIIAWRRRPELAPTL